MNILILVLEGLFLVTVCWGAVEDIRYRAVSLWLLLVADAIGTALLILRALENSVIWSLGILILVLAVTLWTVLKQKAGWADFMLMGGMFSGFRLNICFWTVIMGLLVSAILLCIKKIRKEGVPFFSVMGFSMLCVYVGNMIWMILRING